MPILWGRRDLNPHALRHVILSHACLPIPALPRLLENYKPRVFYSQRVDYNY
jgi:hypothetical protein